LGLNFIQEPVRQKILASAIQQQYWLLNQLNPNSPAYNIFSVFHIQGDLHIDRLETCVNILYRQYDVLRSTFALEGEDLFQIQHPFENIRITIEDVEHGKNDQTMTMQLIKDEVTRIFDLEKGPILRFKLFRIDNEEYYLIITMHHIIIDLRSKEIIGERLSFLYNSAQSNEAAIDEAVSYARFAQWQREWFFTSEFSEMLSFWRETLNGSDGLLTLPTDHPRPPHGDLRGSVARFDISSGINSDLRNFCRDRSLSPFLTLLSVYIVLLNRYSGQERIIVGVPYTNRRKKNHKNTVGCFVNMLPLAVDITKNTTFMDLLVQTGKAMLEAYRRQEVPIEAIVNTLGTSRNSSYNPLYQVGFTFDHPMILTLDGLDVKPVFAHNGGSLFDMMMLFWDHDDGFEGRIEYNSDLYNAKTIERMIGHFMVLLGHALTSPNTQIDAMPMLTDDEHRFLIHGVNATEAPFDSTACVHRLFEKQVRQRPDKTAVIFGDRALTYNELNRAANVFAIRLKSMGSKCGDHIGILSDRTAEMIIGILGILKAGCAYIPLDPELPQERLEFMADDANIAFLASSSTFAGALPNCKAPLAIIDAYIPEASDWENCNFDCDPNNTMYIIYTSGSTGIPKGVPIRHRSVVNLLTSMIKTQELTCDDTWLAVASFSFDVSIPDLFLPIAVGATVVFAGKQATLDGDQLSDLLLKNNVTVMQATATTMRLLLSSNWPGSSRLKVLCGGEPVTFDIVRDLLPKIGQLWNMYGPTETTVYAAWHRIATKDEANVIGRPPDNMRVWVVDDTFNPVPIGIPGELLVGGEGVSQGYLNRPALTSDRFIPAPKSLDEAASLIYRTGDIVRWRQGGVLEYLHRIDNQVKVRGFRIELGEIETAIENSSCVKQCVVRVRDDIAEDKHIVAYITLNRENLSEQSAITDIRKHIAIRLPSYMHPSFYVVLESFPLTVTGKIDRKALPPPETSKSLGASSRGVLYTEEEKKVASVWLRLLHLDNIPLDVSFFDAGGTSLLAARLAVELRKLYGRRIPVAMIFQYPTIRDLSQVLGGENGNQPPVSQGSVSMKHPADHANQKDFDDIAIVGMSCRFPGANNIDSYWQMLTEGREQITFFDKEKIPVDIDRSTRDNGLYVRARGIVSDVDLFDADFFGFTRQIAEVLDPQIRLFIENSCEALENAGYASGRHENTVGVYAGTGRSSYLHYNILTRSDIIDRVGDLQIELGNDKDFIATRLSHSLNLTGPSICLSTACSTSLVAIIMACQALSRGDCTIAIAGGSNIAFPIYRGYLHQEGAIYSRDGHCRPFDADATGTTFSDGVGVVVLKKLSKALAENNIVYAIIKGGAINNDGSKKVSFSAPGVDGQVNVISAALDSAVISADTVTYVETHGTATQLGDPIEIEALSQAFRKGIKKNQLCAIGSVKSNIGHTAIAAGAAGFIKTALMLYHKTLVPSINFQNPNPAIDFESSPFYVNTKLAPWQTNGAPRRAGVSSFGFGGTNAHVILEEAPPRNPSGPSRPWQMLPFSAKSPSALNAAMHNFGGYIAKNPDVSLPDCAYTLQAHRTDYLFRRYIVCRTNQEARAAITSEDTSIGGAHAYSQRSPSLVFMFPGQGTQYAGMGAALYGREPVFRAAFDRCAAALRRAMDEDILDALFSAGPDALEKLKSTYYAQPALFAVEYALSKLWQDWGLKPRALVGHSIGEFVAACVSGVMEVEDAAALVAARARLMQTLPPGAMLSVRLPESEVLSILPPDLSIAAVNSPLLCVVSGPLDAIEEFKAGCEKNGVACRPLHTSHGFHSAMVDPIIPVFNAEVLKIRLSTPTIPIVSTVTGKLLTNNEATDPEYWTRHMRVTVRFSDAIKSLLDSEGEKVFLEVGPRATSATLVQQQIRDRKRHCTVTSLGDQAESVSDYRELIDATGQLWLRGISLDWASYYRDEKRLQVPLPSYPFDRQRYWIEHASPRTHSAPANETAQKNEDPSSPKPANQSPSEALPAASATVADAIRGMITEAMGGAAGAIDDSATFLQIGLDSLFLTQLSQRIKTKFGVTVGMRQLMREYATVSKLADFIAKDMTPNGRA